MRHDPCATKGRCCGERPRGERRRGPSEEERTAMKRFDRVAAGIVFALAAVLSPRGAEARDVTIELMNAQGQPIGHATIAPESGGGGPPRGGTALPPRPPGPPFPHV